jgi:hypothetical protein
MRIRATTTTTTTRLIGSLLTGLAAGIAFGDVYVVDDNPGLGVDFNRIQDAVNAAQDGDKIMVNAGRYTEFGVPYVINTMGKQLEIVGVPGQTIIDGEHKRRGIVCDSNEGPTTVFRDLVIMHGFGGEEGGGGMYVVDGSPQVHGCLFDANSAVYAGGAVMVTNGGFLEPSFTDCEFRNNRTEHEGSTGGAVMITGDGSFNRCEFSANRGGYGGAVYLMGGEDPSFTECDFRYNEASSIGGAVRVFDSKPVFEECFFWSNIALEGGAVHQYEGSSTFYGTRFELNSAWDPSPVGNEWMPDSLGGAIFLDEADLYANKCQLVNNSALNGLEPADDRGGAIYMNAGSRLEMIDSSLDRNRSEHGGAIASMGTCLITMTRCNLDENIASMDGGGLNLMTGASMTDDECNYRENEAGRSGGAIHGVKTRIDMSDATFEDNVANENPAARFESARAIQIEDTLVMSNWCDTPSAAMAIHADLNVWEPGVIIGTTFSSNQGSGLHIEMNRDHQEFLLEGTDFSGNVGLGGAAIIGGRATVENSTFYYNSNNANNYAGGLLFSSDNGRISNTEFRGNDSRWAGGLYLIEDRSAHVVDCEFNHNTSQVSGGGAAVSNNGSLIERCTFTNNGSGQGGGLYSYHSEVLPEGGGATVRDCMFVGNNANNEGGGICNSGNTGMLVDTCEFTSNFAHAGGGISNGLWGGMTIRTCDIRQNQAVEGGGLWTEDESATDLQDTVICSNVVNQVTGLFNDLGGNTIANECPVFNPADLDGNGLVDGSDLAKLLGNWGPCFGIDCVADVNGDGTVDGGDLSILLGAWN